MQTQNVFICHSIPTCLVIASDLLSDIWPSTSFYCVVLYCVRIPAGRHIHMLCPKEVCRQLVAEISVKS